MKTRETLDPCQFCYGNWMKWTATVSVFCERCNGHGEIWRDRCYAGRLDELEFAWWQMKLAGRIEI